MRKKNFIILIGIFFFLFFSNADALVVRQTPLVLTTSIIVPCHYTHLKYIPELLIHYRNQSVVPDEIIISISEINRISVEVIDALENEQWPFKLLILRNSDAVSAGRNRNLATLISTGNIIICQDADDIPHPQRVEIIKYLFETYRIDHLLHGFAFNNDFKSYDRREANELCRYCSVLHPHQGNITNGNPAFIRSVLEKVNWSDSSAGEDCGFNAQVYQNYPYKVVFSESLYYYRRFLTTVFNDIPDEENKRRTVEEIDSTQK